MLTFKHSFQPLHFLNTLGAGGIGITFFMYLMFLTQHPNTPVPTFESLSLAFYKGTLLLKVLIITGMLGMIFFGIYHFLNLFQSIKEYLLFKKTETYKNLKKTNDEIQLMVIPLTFGMTMNVLFTLSAVFVPNLWTIIEYIFPLAITGFLIIGFFAFKILINYYKRLFAVGNFDFEQNNNLSQLLSIFSLAMIGVGLSGPAAMSRNESTALIALIFSVSFFSVALVFFLVKFILGFKSILQKGWSFEALPSVWIIIPFLTLFGIALIRYQHAFHTIFNMPINKPIFFIITISFTALQVFFGILGHSLMKEKGYFKKYIEGKEASIGSLALICPLVAFVVFGFFLIHKGFLDNDLLQQFSPVYFLLLAIYVFFQIKTLIIYYQINRKLIKVKKTK